MIKYNAIKCQIEALGDVKSNDTLILRARQVENWGHAGLNRRSKLNDFIALYRADWNHPRVHGLRRVDIAKVLCPMAIIVPGYHRERFQVVYTEELRRCDYSVRAKCTKFKLNGNLETLRGYNLEDVETIFRPVHMTPEWHDNTERVYYLNNKTDIHAWMELWDS